MSFELKLVQTSQGQLNVL